MSGIKRHVLRAGKCVTALVAFGAVPFIINTSSAWAETNACSANLQTPHYSSGAGGIISKGTWQCTDVPTTVTLAYPNGQGFNLWLCTDKSPTRTEAYLQNDPNCLYKGTDASNISATVANATYTRYVPPSGQSGAHGSGWWVACAVWRSFGPKGTGGPTTSFSPIWEGSG